MTVYVDNMNAKFGRLIMCHMVADTDQELHAMADAIGVDRKWFQAPPRHRPHYDIAKSKRALAVGLGAVEITWRQAGAMTSRKALTGELGNPEDAESWLAKYRSEKKTATGGQLLDQSGDTPRLEAQRACR